MALPNPLPPLQVLIGMAADETSQTGPFDAAIVAAARRGEPAAFERLVRSVQRSVYGLCLRLLRTEAEAAEVAQETFLRAYQNLSRYDETRPFDLWVLAIARNLCLDLLRRRSKHSPGSLDDVKDTLASDQPSVLDQAIAEQQRLTLEGAVALLPPDDREVLALYYVQKRTTKEIAQIMGVAPGTIMARLFRAREKLRKILPHEEAMS